MPDDPTEPSFRPGPFYTNWGPPDGPILVRAGSPALGVYGDDRGGMPIGVPFPARWVARGDRPPAQAFRLEVGKVEQPGLWLCVGRRFVPLGDSAELV